MDKDGRRGGEYSSCGEGEGACKNQEARIGDGHSYSARQGSVLVPLAATGNK